MLSPATYEMSTTYIIRTYLEFAFFIAVNTICVEIVLGIIIDYLKISR